MKNKKGFTLIEVLLIILLIGLLATTAFTSFFDTSETFSFLSEYKPIVLNLRKARSFAINNKDSDTYERYGLYIDQNNIQMFGDLQNPLQWDGSATDDVKESMLFDGDYSIILRTTIVDAGLPIEIYYESGDGDLTAYATSDGTGEQVLLPKDEYKRLDFEFNNNDGLSRYFYIFQVSGIVEESKVPL